MATNFFSTSQGGIYSGTATNSSVSLDNLRRTFDLSDKIASLTPQESPFFTYLNKIRREPTGDPIFKMMEERPQWQRRNFYVSTALAVGQDITLSAQGIVLHCNYDAYGKVNTSANVPTFFVPGQIVAIENVTETTTQSDTGTLYARVVSYGTTATRLQVAPLFLVGASVTNGKKDVSSAKTTFAIPAGSTGQVVGTAYPEGGSYPDSWHDVLSQTEGYAQIFKTACPVFSGTSMATKYRGRPNEFMRVWANKMKEHKMDLENSFLFNVGHVATSTGALSAEDGTNIRRYTWGAIPFVSLYGKTGSFSYAASGYNDFVDWCKDFFAPESGNSGSKLVFASRDIIGWFNKLGSGSFLGNTLVSDAVKLDIQNVKSQFGFDISRVKTVFGELNFVNHALLRGPWASTAVVLDLPNISYRPLQGNGISRDTFITTNVQAPGVDGRVDQILTEAGLQITLPETCAVLTWR